MKVTHVITVISFLGIVGAGSFFAGLKFQQGKQASLGRQGVFFQSGQLQNGLRQGMMGTGTQGTRMGFRPVTGQIINGDDKSITVKLNDGSSKIVVISDKTLISKAAGGVKEDLTSGETVAAFGLENPDGSITAQNIQLNPIPRTGTQAQ